MWLSSVLFHWSEILISLHHKVPQLNMRSWPIPICYLINACGIWTLTIPLGGQIVWKRFKTKLVRLRDMRHQWYIQCLDQIAQSILIDSKKKTQINKKNPVTTTPEFWGILVVWIQIHFATWDSSTFSNKLLRSISVCVCVCVWHSSCTISVLRCPPKFIALC